MTKSLDKITILRKVLLETWLKDSIDEKKFLNLVQQDSCTLSEAVCCLFSKSGLQEIENISERAGFIIDAPLVAEDLSLDKMFVFEFVNRLFEIYDKAVRAIEGKIFEANRTQEESLSGHFTRYWVKPRDFFLWAYNNEIFQIKPIEEFIKKYVLPKSPGRPRKNEKEMELLLELSNRLENRNKTARQIIDLDKASLVKEKICENCCSKKERDYKLERIEKKLREHPDFGGFKYKDKRRKRQN